MSGIAWQDFANVEGFSGQMSGEALDQLRKALLAGSDVNAPSAAPGVGFPLRVESLERTLKNTSYKMKDVKLWKALPKIPAFNTVEEYNQITDFGNLESGAFMAEGALPEVTDSTYVRKTIRVKYMGTTRGVSHVMTLVKPAHGPILAQEAVAGTLYLVRQLEKNSFVARSDLDDTQFDGIEKQIEDGALATSIIDMRGRGLTEDVLMDASLTAFDAPNFGRMSHWFLNPKVHSDLSKQFFPKARYALEESGSGEMKIGRIIREIVTPAGDMIMEPDVFIDDGGQTPAGGAGAFGDASKRPADPTISTSAAAGSNANSLFDASTAATHRYTVQAFNQFGASNAVVVNAGGTAIAAAQALTFGVTPGGGNSPKTTYYKVFRTMVHAAAVGTGRLLLRVVNAAAAGETTVTDLNARLPGTTTVYGIQLELENIAWKQLAPMMKISLSTNDTSVRWAQVIYGTPVVYTPRHNIIIRNVGRTADFAGAP